jgi:hypothetical protein
MCENTNTKHLTNFCSKTEPDVVPIRRTENSVIALVRCGICQDSVMLVDDDDTYTHQIVIKANTDVRQ